MRCRLRPLPHATSRRAGDGNRTRMTSLEGRPDRIPTDDNERYRPTLRGFRPRTNSYEHRHRVEIVWRDCTTMTTHARRARRPAHTRRSPGTATGGVPLPAR